MTVRPWDDYHVIMWIGDTAYSKPEKLPLFFQRLREMGITTGMTYGDKDPAPLLHAGMPYYVENIVNRGLCLKFNSAVTDWDKFVTSWAKGGRGEGGLVRDYCLDDPDWLKWAQEQMRRVAGKNAARNPVAYDIRDELSTTMSANPFDYDFNPKTLAAFRQWLKGQYADLSALNREWQTSFAGWDEVKPFTTDQIKQRMVTGESLPQGKPDWSAVQAVRFEWGNARKEPKRWNLAPWADFRTYMDISLARSLAQLRQAAREIDPRTPVGIEGTQMPHAFGGYDLWRLSQVLDWVEPYDIGNAREIFGSFMPRKPILTTVFEKDTEHARRRLWHLLLEGDRGCIIWWSEDCINWNSPEYELTPKARALAPVLKEMTSDLAKLFIRAERIRDPILIHYSQPSIQVDWLIESTVDGSTWLRRFSSFEAEHNRQAKIRNGWLKALQDLGFSPRFVSSEQIESGELRNSAAALVLPSSWALSDREVASIKQFLTNPELKLVFFDGLPGAFDGHGQLRDNTALGEEEAASPEQVRVLSSTGGRRSWRGDIASATRARLTSAGTNTFTAWLGKQLREVRTSVAVPPEVRVRVHRFRLGHNLLVAFERNIDYQMSEDLKEAGGNEALEQPVEFDATFRKAYHVYDLWNHEYLGRQERTRIKLDPWRPALYALCDNALDAKNIVEQLTSK